MDNVDDLSAESSRRTLGVMTLGDDSVKELPALAELHHEVDGVPVLVGPLELHDVAVASEVVHDLDLPADVLEVVLADELPCGNGLAGELLPGLAVGDQIGDSELAPAEFAPEGVNGADVLHWPAEDAANIGCDGAGDGRGSVRVGGGSGGGGGMGVVARVGTGRGGGRRRLLVAAGGAVAHLQFGSRGEEDGDEIERD